MINLTWRDPLTDMSIMTVVMVMIAVNAALLAHRLRRLLRRIPEPYNTPRLDIVLDAITVIAGVYLLAWVVDVTMSGIVSRWGLMDYVFVGLIALNTGLAVACSIIAGRRGDKETRSHHPR